MKYQSEIIKEIVDKRGHKFPSLHYQSECVESWIEEARPSYPKLCDYQSEWLNYINNHEPIGKFPYVSLTDVTEATVNNVVPYVYKSAILKGSTKYRDIDTGEVLDAFEDGRNLELVSVKVPVLTTSNEDGTKTNILSCNEEVTLRGIGDVKDTLDCLTGEVTERIGEIVLDGSEDEKYNDGWSKEAYAILLDEYVGRTPVISPDIPYTGFRKQTYPSLWSANDRLFLVLPKIYTNGTQSNAELRKWLQKNPIKIQYQLATPTIKTVDLNVEDQDGNTLSKIKPIEGTMHISTDGNPIKPTFTGEVPVEAITQNLASFIEE